MERGETRNGEGRAGFVRLGWRDSCGWVLWLGRWALWWACAGGWEEMVVWRVIRGYLGGPLGGLVSGMN